jgi:hypothetical protein
MKANASTWALIQVDGSPNDAYAYVDLQNGIIGTTSSSNIIEGIEDIGVGWYRVFVSLNDVATRVRIYPADGNGTVSATSGSIYIQHAQLESGSYPTSIIETTTSAVTRIADVANNCGSEQDFNSEEGVLYAEMSALADDLTQRFISLSDGTSANRLILGFDNSSNRIISFARVGGGLSFDIKETVSNIQSYNKIAIKWKENDFALWSNGVELRRDTSGASFSSNVLNTLKFSDADGTTEIFNGKVRSLKYFPEALGDTKLITLTGGDGSLQGLFNTFQARVLADGGYIESQDCIINEIKELL